MSRWFALLELVAVLLVAFGLGLWVHVGAGMVAAGVGLGVLTIAAELDRPGDG